MRSSPVTVTRSRQLASPTRFTPSGRRPRRLRDTARRRGSAPRARPPLDPGRGPLPRIHRRRPPSPWRSACNPAISRHGPAALGTSCPQQFAGFARAPPPCPPGASEPHPFVDHSAAWRIGTRGWPRGSVRAGSKRAPRGPPFASVVATGGVACERPVTGSFHASSNACLIEDAERRASRIVPRSRVPETQPTITT